MRTLMAIAILLLTSEQALADNDSLSAEAKLFVSSYWAGWSQSNNSALSYLKTVVADPITFYGKSIPLKSFMEIQTTFADRWPNRSYTLQPNSLVTSCNQESSGCQISGIVNWIDDSPVRKAHSVGSANFQFNLLVQDSVGKDRFLIAEETGSVISRTLTTGTLYIPPLPNLSPNNLANVPNNQASSAGSSESSPTVSAVSPTPSQPVNSNPPNGLTFSDPTGIAYANLGETTWTTNKSSDEMTDQTDISVVSNQQNDTGVSAQVTGTCANNVETFTATITDNSGQATVNLANLQNPYGAGYSVVGNLRINSQPEATNVFVLPEFDNAVEIAQLSIGEAGSSDDPSAGDGSGLSPIDQEGLLDLRTTWRILAEFDTDHGPILIKIPLYDPQIESFTKACIAENVGSNSSGSSGNPGQ